MSPPAALLTSRENFKYCSGAGLSLCTEGVFGSLRNLMEEPGRKEMWSLIPVSIRADSTVPSMWDEGPVMTRISLNLQRIRSLSDEIAVAHNGRQHRRDMVVSCTAPEESGGMVEVPSMTRVSWAISPKAQLLVRRHTNLVLGCPSTVRRFRVDEAQVELGSRV